MTIGKTQQENGTRSRIDNIQDDICQPSRPTSTKLMSDVTWLVDLAESKIASLRVYIVQLRLEEIVNVNNQAMAIKIIAGELNKMHLMFVLVLVPLHRS